MDNDLSKRFYKIGEVARLTGIPESTLRFWEKRFTVVSPRRNGAGTRFYTPADIEKIRLIYYLVKEKGLKLDAAQAMIKANPDGLDRRAQVVGELREIRASLRSLLDQL